MQVGGVNAVMATMKTLTDSADVQQHATTAMSNLSANPENLRTHLEDFTASVGCLLVVMQAHPLNKGALTGFYIICFN